jgi:hypothetical protein
MFSLKNRALQLSVVQKPAGSTTPDATAPCTHRDYDEIAQIAMYHAEHAAKIVVGVVVANKLLNTACQIAVITAQAKIK